MPALPLLRDEPTRHPGCCLSLSEPLLATIASLLRSPYNLLYPDNKNYNEHAFGPQSRPTLLLSIGSGTGLLEELLHVYLNHDARAIPEKQIGMDDSQLTSDHTDGSSSSRPRLATSPPRPFGPGWRVEGVEVSPAVNIHLPEDRINHVPGSWAVLETRARSAGALMFVYPRDGALVRRYVDAFMAESGAESEVLTAADDRLQEVGDGDGDGKRAQEGARSSGGLRRGGARLVLWLGPKCDWDDTGLGCGAGRGLEILEMRGGAGLAEYEMLAALRRKTATTM
ncbi:hypothetical protein F5Y10DRAFT_250595 [Nemania abortiva]|nr:hypothetical protein F5Y10DRAFT_250595 [Nemania abortiva]